jgi:hypothetical protein
LSNFEQSASAKEHMEASGRRSTVRCPMSIADQFWQYAREALLSACEAKTTDDRKGLLELAQTWTQAALVERRSLMNNDKTDRAAYATVLLFRRRQLS